MTSIRFGTFETNSSSMHAIVINCVSSKADVRDYLREELKPYKTDTGKYALNVVLDDELISGQPFSVRSYYCHTNIMDKLMYLFAVIVDHYDMKLEHGPIKPVKYTWEKPARFTERKKEYKEDIVEWNKKDHSANDKIIKDFEDHMKDLTYWLNHYIAGALTDDKNERDDFCKVNFTYRIEAGNIIAVNPNKDFSLGCYGHKELYYAIASRAYDSAEWVVCPYTAILAGSDEMEEDERLAQKKEAARLINISWQKYILQAMKNHTPEEIKEDPAYALNPATVIWPIGG
jgi:hypothetical protein